MNDWKQKAGKHTMHKKQVAFCRRQHFDNPVAKEAISERLYFMAQNGMIERRKTGRTYSLKVR